VAASQAMKTLLNGTFGSGAGYENWNFVLYGDIVSCLDYYRSFASWSQRL